MKASYIPFGRGLVVPAWFLSACLLLFGCKGRSADVMREPASEAAADVAAAPAAEPASVFGVHRGGVLRARPAGVERLLNDASELGAGWLRLNLRWDDIESSEGEYDWSLADAVVENAARTGVHLMLNVRGYSEVALYEGDREAKLAAYADLLRQLVQRYSGRVSFWQIENEVISRRFWKLPLEDYTRVLATAHATIKGEDDSASVVLAGFPLRGLEFRVPESDWSADDRERVADIRFLLREARPFFDVLDLHLYYLAESIPSRIAFFRNEMMAAGYSRPIWVGETGGPDLRFYPGEPLPSVQQGEVIKRYTLALASGAERVFWHGLRGGGLASDRAFSAMPLEQAGQRTPAFATYQLMVSKLSGFTSVAPVGSVDGLHVYRFTRPGGDVYVLWSEREQSVPVPGGLASFVVTDVLGAENVFDDSTVRVSPSPVFLQAAG